MDLRCQRNSSTLGEQVGKEIRRWQSSLERKGGGFYWQHRDVVKHNDILIQNTVTIRTSITN